MTVNVDGFGTDVTVSNVKRDLISFLSNATEEITEAVLIIRTPEGVATISSVTEDASKILLEESMKHSGYIEKSGFNRNVGTP